MDGQEVKTFGSEGSEITDETINEEPSLNNKEDDEIVYILMVGLDNSGKTKLLYTLKCGFIEETVRTIGFNVETLEYNSIKYEVWDIGGHHTVRVLRNSCTANKSIVIYVVDASDEARFPEAKDDLHDVMNNSDLNNVVLLVLANKIDLVPGLVINDLIERLNLNSISQKWMIHACSVVADGHKLYDIHEKLQELIKNT